MPPLPPPTPPLRANYLKKSHQISKLHRVAQGRVQHVVITAELYLPKSD